MRNFANFLYWLQAPLSVSRILSERFWAPVFRLVTMAIVSTTLQLLPRLTGSGNPSSETIKMQVLATKAEPLIKLLRWDVKMASRRSSSVKYQDRSNDSGLKGMD